jgi:thioredoxin reductase
MSDKIFDVIIIGGSYAGLSAALALGRSLRQVLVIDSGKPCNRFAPHSQNFLTHDGQKPGDIAVKAKQDVQHYKTVEFYEGVATKAIKEENAFQISTTSGSRFKARKLILATGLKDIMPGIPGFEACWGKSVIHCPYCHGYEFAGEATAIIDNGDSGFHYAEMIANWTKNLIIFTNGPSTFSSEQLVKLKKHNIHVIDSELESIQHEKGQVHAVVTKDGVSIPVRAIYNRPKYVQHSDIPEALGCELTDAGLLKIDEFRKTNVAGVFACGDNSSMRAVSAAVYTGTMAGTMVNMELIKEDF